MKYNTLTEEIKRFKQLSGIQILNEGGEGDIIDVILSKVARAGEDAFNGEIGTIVSNGRKIIVKPSYYSKIMAKETLSTDEENLVRTINSKIAAQLGVNQIGQLLKQTIKGMDASGSYYVIENYLDRFDANTARQIRGTLARPTGNPQTQTQPSVNPQGKSANTSGTNWDNINLNRDNINLNSEPSADISTILASINSELAEKIKPLIKVLIPDLSKITPEQLFKILNEMTVYLTAQQKLEFTTAIDNLTVKLKTIDVNKAANDVNNTDISAKLGHDNQRLNNGNQELLNRKQELLNRNQELENTDKYLKVYNVKKNIIFLFAALVGLGLGIPLAIKFKNAGLGGILTGSWNWVIKGFPGGTPAPQPNNQPPTNNSQPSTNNSQPSTNNSQPRTKVGGVLGDLAKY